MRYVALLMISVMLCGAVGAKDLSQNEALQLREAGRIIALDDLLTNIDTRYPHARLLDIELDEEDDAYVYEVELITRDGVVRELLIDATTGHILEDEIDD